MGGLPSVQSKLDLPHPIAPAHDLGEVGASHELLRVDAGGRGHEPSLAIEKLVGEGDHPRVRPCLRPRLQQAVSQFILSFVRAGLRQDHQRGRRRAGDSRVAVDKQAAGFGRVSAKAQDRFDI